MCGICCYLINEASEHKQQERNTFQTRLNRRGPNWSSEKCININSSTKLKICGHVLHMRGQLTPQPTVDSLGNSLLWNGEIFGGIQVENDENDTQVLLKILSDSADPSHVLTTLSRIHGPWAFIYWQNSQKTLWFGRDVLGRRSLCWHLPAHDNDVFMLTSVRQNEEILQEVPSIGIFSLDLNQTDELDVTLYTWTEIVWPGTTDMVTNESLSSYMIDMSLNRSNIKFKVDPYLKIQNNIPILNKSLPDLDNSFVSVDDPIGFTKHLLDTDSIIDSHVDHLLKLLQDSVQVRAFTHADFSTPSDCHRLNTHADDVSGENLTNIQKSPQDFCQEFSDMEKENNKSKVAVLFSGGVDSAVIAAILDRCLPKNEPVDLINVAFEKHTTQGQRNTPDDKWNVPDRQIGLQALQELSSDRQWNFIMVNVSITELQQTRADHIRHLVYPLETVLDDSIGCAVWFAARGNGVLGNGRDVGKEYRSTAKVILCGMGADEQFAGYSRHRGKFEELGWKGLLDEVEFDVRRISSRNLGRDDRVITDHGKEARFPFLDENVVAYLQQLPIHQKANLKYQRGLGEKLLLRACALKLGLVKSSFFPKRAIQFGSRIAKAENNKEKASEKCRRLQDKT